MICSPAPRRLGLPKNNVLCICANAHESQLTSVSVSGKWAAAIGAGCGSCELSDHSSPTERRSQPPRHPASTAPGPGDGAGAARISGLVPGWRWRDGEMGRCYTIIIWSSSTLSTHCGRGGPIVPRTVSFPTIPTVSCRLC